MMWSRVVSSPVISRSIQTRLSALAPMLTRAVVTSSFVQHSSRGYARAARARQPMHWLTKLFVAALSLHMLVQVWLSWRQCRAVRIRRGEVPPLFGERITAADQAKATDYTIAKQRAGAWHALIDGIVLLWLTLGGGLDFFSRVSAAFVQHPLPQGTLHVLLVAAFLALIGLPFSIYRQFSIEQRFGFNRMSAALYVMDTVKSWLIATVIAAMLVLAILAIMEAVGGYWWLVAWAAWLVVSLLLVIAWPRWIAPLFNRFTRVED